MVRQLDHKDWSALVSNIEKQKKNTKQTTPTKNQHQKNPQVLTNL